MAPKLVSLFLIDIERELAGVEARATELRCALKIIDEFTVECAEAPPEPKAHTPPDFETEAALDIEARLPFEFEPDLEEMVTPTYRGPGPGRSRLAAMTRGGIDETNVLDLPL